MFRTDIRKYIQMSRKQHFSVSITSLPCSNSFQFCDTYRTINLVHGIHACGKNSATSCNVLKYIRRIRSQCVLWWSEQVRKLQLGLLVSAEISVHQHGYCAAICTLNWHRILTVDYSCSRQLPLGISPVIAASYYRCLSLEFSALHCGRLYVGLVCTCIWIERH